MARIRSIKPEFWDSPSTARAELAARLTYIALWNWADDSGHGTANLKELEAFCFPNDDVTSLPKMGGCEASGDSRGNSAHTCGTFRNFAEVLRNTAEAFGITFYEVSGRYYYRIDNFRQHQSKDFREKSKYPKPEDGQIVTLTSGNGFHPALEEGSQSHAVAESPAIVAEIPAHSAEKRTLEQGNRVIGEQGNRGKTYAQNEFERTSNQDDEPEQEPANTYPQTFEEWWQHYPRKVGKRKALNEWQRATKRITNAELIQATKQLAAFHAQEQTDPQYIKHPQGWLSRDGWEDELTPTRKPDHGINAWLPQPQDNIIDAEIEPERNQLPPWMSN